MRPKGISLLDTLANNFPSFSEGLSLRPPPGMSLVGSWVNFPSFSEGLSLRRTAAVAVCPAGHFPSFSEGLSLRLWSEPTAPVP